MKKHILTFILCVTLALLPSCNTTQDYIVTYTGDSIGVQNIAAASPTDATGVEYNHKLKKAFITYASGENTELKVIGGGLGAGGFVLILEGGAKITVDTKTGKVTTTPGITSPLPLP